MASFSIFAQDIENTSLIGVWETDETDTINESIRINGWVADTATESNNNAGIERIYAVQGNDCSGHIWYETPPHIDRQDVVDALGDNRYTTTGFDFAVSIDEIPFQKVTVTVCVDALVAGIGHSLGTKEFTINRLTKPDISGYLFSVFAILMLMFSLLYGLMMRYWARIRYTRRAVVFVIIAVLVSIIPVLMIISLINQFGTVPPILDDWGVVTRRFISYRNGGISELFPSAWVLHGAGHRAFAPAILSTFVANHENLNMLAIYSVNLVFGMMIIIYATDIVCTLTETRRYTILMIIFALIIFNPSVRFWIDKRFLAIIMGVLGLMGSLHALVTLKKSWFSFILSMFWAWLGSVSFFSGNLIWVLLFPLLYMYGYRHVKYYAIWMVIAATVLIPFLLDYSPSDVSGVFTPTVPLLLEAIFVYFGMPFHFATVLETIEIFEIPISHILGFLNISIVMALTLFHTIWFRRYYQSIYVVMVMPIFVVILAIFATMGRLTEDSGIRPLFVARYAIYGVVGWIGFIILVAYTSERILGSTRYKDTREFAVAFLNIIIGMISGLMLLVSMAQSPPTQLFESLVEADQKYIASRLSRLVYQLQQYPPSILVEDRFNMTPELGIYQTQNAIQRELTSSSGSEITVIDTTSEEPLQWLFRVNNVYDVTLFVGVINETDDPITTDYSLNIRPQGTRDISLFSFSETLEPGAFSNQTIDLSQFENQRVLIQLERLNDGLSWIRPQVMYNMRSESTE